MAALALARTGIATTLVATRARPDNRTTALHHASIMALETLGVWERCRDHAEALRVMRIVDDTARLIRAPEVSFTASEIGYDAFGHNIENRHLVAALETEAAALDAFTRIEATATSAELGERGV